MSTPGGNCSSPGSRIRVFKSLLDRHLVFWGGLIAVGIWAFRRYGERPRSGQALTILQERFARGEIDIEEYQRRKQVLEGGAQP